MTIDQAIEVLSNRLGEGPQLVSTERRDAVRMGVKALKAIQYMRLLGIVDTNYKLPGETKD